MRAIRFVFISLFCFFGILYLIFLTYLYFNQESMIFFPSRLAPDYQYGFEHCEEMSISCADGKKLNGLLFTTDTPKGLVFYLHGNAGALDRWGDIAPHYTDLGYDIFILDYRGFGKSEGTIENEGQFYSDISAAYKKLSARYLKNTVIIGYSIGTGPAAYLASKNHPSVLILQAPYYNLTELADARAPLVPDFLKKYHFETNVFLPKVQCPVYLFHGNADHVISYDNSVRLNELMKGKAQFFTLEGADHSGMNDDERYLSELKIILDKASK
jgi:pimeloyl-ACP methyl ester carboxylesterase